MFEWNKVVEEDFDRRRKEADSEIQKIKMTYGKSFDLGAQFNDPRLNTMVTRKAGDAESFPLYRFWEEGGALFFKCAVCSVQVYGKRNLDCHISGKKHATNMLDFSQTDSPSASPPAVPTRPVVSHLLSRYKVAPLLGLDYIVEVLVGRTDAEYHCLLCETISTARLLMFHLLSAQHRVGYLQNRFRVLHRKFARVKNIDFWEESTFDLLDTVSSRIEAKFGRREPSVVESIVIFDRERKRMMENIQSRDHIRESDDFNFKTLMDPFGKYLYKIPHQEMTR